VTLLLERLRAVHALPTDRVVIVSLRDLGMTHAANVGVYDVLDAVVSSATLAVPCPWSRHASARYDGEDVGVQLTLNAQHELYRWSPVTHAPSLVDGNGGFPMTAAEFWDHADLDEVRRECRAQIERAVLWGIDVSHLVSHLDALALRPEFFDVLLDLAVDFDLPVALPDEETSQRAGFPLRDLAAEEGILFPDHIVNLMHESPTSESLRSVFSGLEAGVTELRFAPTIDAPEIRALSLRWAQEVAQHDVLTDAGGTTLRHLAGQADVTLTTFRVVRAAQRHR
jgi:chitin disaccharide deacetylase